MRPFLDVKLPKKQQKPAQARVGVLSGSESGHAIPFLHRTCSPRGFVRGIHNTTDTTGRSSHRSFALF